MGATVRIYPLAASVGIIHFIVLISITIYLLIKKRILQNIILLFLSYNFLQFLGGRFITNQSFKDTFVKLKGELYNTRNHISRPDVAEEFENPNFKNAGFEFAISTAELKETNNEISIIVLCDGASIYTEAQAINFNITDNLTGEK